MTIKYKNLLSPIKVGNTRLRNRIIAAPTTLHSASNGEQYPTEEAVVYFANKAKAGDPLSIIGRPVPDPRIMMSILLNSSFRK